MGSGTLLVVELHIYSIMFFIDNILTFVPVAIAAAAVSIFTKWSQGHEKSPQGFEGQGQILKKRRPLQWHFNNNGNDNDTGNGIVNTINPKT